MGVVGLAENIANLPCLAGAWAEPCKTDVWVKVVRGKLTRHWKGLGGGKPHKYFLLFKEIFSRLGTKME